MENQIWTKENYQQYLSDLINQKEETYKEFQQKLIPTNYPILGIRIPTQRKIAKQIAKTDIISFFETITDTYFEEIMIEGFVIATIKEETLFLKYLEQYLPKIDNWAICDSFCNSLKLPSYHPEKYFDYFLNLLKSKESFTIRVGLITMLSCYIKEKYIPRILQAIDEISSNHYYVNMGMAWLLAEIYISNPKCIENFLKHTKCNDFTVNKTISKIRESYRVSKEQKNEILKYKRRKETC